MVQFNKENRTFTVEFHGNEEDYFNKLRSLGRLLAVSNHELLDPDTLYHGSTLLEEMLPGATQSVAIVLE